MKSLRTFLTLLLCTLSVFFFSCENEEPLQVNDLEQLLVSKTWKLVSVKINGNEVSSTCSEDNTVRYFENRTYESDTGSMVCDEPDFYDGGIITGKWEITHSGSFLELRHDDSSFDVDLKIIELTNSKMILSALSEEKNMEQTWIPQ